MKKREKEEANIRSYLCSLPIDTWIVFTDGSCPKNPGTAGIGVVLFYPPSTPIISPRRMLGFVDHKFEHPGSIPTDSGEIHELSAPIGIGTNNIAELKAIEYAIDAITARLSLPNIPPPSMIRILTDSKYAIGVLSKNWNIHENVTLIHQIRVKYNALVRHVRNCEFKHVLGHSKVAGNERADKLAAIAARRNPSPTVTR